MKIGDLSLDFVERTAEEVRESLLHLVGLSVEEMHAALHATQVAGTVASALIPLLAEPIHRHELAEAIAKEGVDEVRAQVRALYADIIAKEAPVGKTSTKAKPAS